MSSYHLSTLLLFSLSCHQPRYQRSAFPCQQNISTIPPLSKQSRLPGLTFTVKGKKPTTHVFILTTQISNSPYFTQTPNKCQHPITKKTLCELLCVTKWSNGPTRQAAITHGIRVAQVARHSVTIYLLYTYSKNGRSWTGTAPPPAPSVGIAKRCAVLLQSGEKCRDKSGSFLETEERWLFGDRARRRLSLQLPE